MAHALAFSIASSTINVRGAVTQVVGDGDTTVYQRWSNPATWGGTLPATGQSLTITSPVMYDLPNAEMGDVTVGVGGLFKPDPLMDTALTFKSFTVDGGTYTNGTATRPFGVDGHTHYLRAKGSRVPGMIVGQTHIGDIPTGNDGLANDNYGLNRGIRVMNGGQFLVKSYLPPNYRTFLSTNAGIGETSIQVADPVYYKRGQTLFLPFMGFQSSARRGEYVTVAADTNGSTTVQLQAPLTQFHWGLLMYPTDDGLSLSPTALILPGMTPTQIANAVITSFTLAGTRAKSMKADSSTQVLIDQRTPVELVDRQSNFQGVNDDDWNNDKFGLHMMFMGLDSNVDIDGAGLRYVGQGGSQGRYPIHWHLVSYDAPTGNLLGDLNTSTTAVGKVSRCYIRDSIQRAGVIHATCGAILQNNTAENITGHAWFLEDATERRNVLSGNRTYGVRTPSPTYALKVSEITASGGRVTAYWFSNLDNTLTNNWASDVDGVGIWNIPGIRHTNTSKPVITGSGMAKFVCPGTLVYSSVQRTITATCTNAATPAIFSRTTSDGTTLANVVATGDFNTGTTAGALTISSITTAFVVGDTITWTNTPLGGAFGPSKLAGQTQDSFLLPPLLYSGNKAWGCSLGVFSQQPIYNEAHALGGTQKIGSYSGGGPAMNFDATEIHHCTQAYNNQVDNPRYTRWITCDNRQVDFAGATSPAGQATTTGLLTVHKTFNLDDETSALDQRDSGLNNYQHASLSTYHGTLLHLNVTAFNFSGGVPTVVNQNAVSYLQSVSVFEGWDFYIGAMDKSFALNTGAKLFNSLLMFRSPPLWRTQPYYGDVTGTQNGLGNAIGNASCVYDADGVLSGNPAAAGAWNLTSHPFVTTGSNDTPSAPASHSSWTKTRMIAVYIQVNDFGQSAWSTTTFGSGKAWARTYSYLPSNQGGRVGGPAAYASGGGVDYGNSNADQHFSDVQGYNFQRFDPTTLTPLTDGNGNAIDIYESPSAGLINFRKFIHAAAPVNSAVRVSIKGTTPPVLFASGSLQYLNMTAAAGDASTDSMLIGQDWAGPAAPSFIGIGKPLNGGINGSPNVSSASPPGLVSGSVALTQFTGTATQFTALSTKNTGGWYWFEASTNTMWMRIYPPNTTSWGVSNGHGDGENEIRWLIRA